MMRQAIITRYLGPTDFRGARVKATAQAGSITVQWNYTLDVNENHSFAAQRLADKLEWLQNSSRLHGGALPSGDGNCYVIVEVSK